MPNAIPISNKPVVTKRNVGIPEKLRVKFFAWLVQNHFTHEGKASMKMFIKSIKAGGWQRKSIKRFPIPTVNTYGRSNVCLAMPVEGYDMFKKAVHDSYLHWPCLFVDFVEGNWQRVD